VWPQARACLGPQITPAAEFRILLSWWIAAADWEVMASIGHEPQHALEVFRDTAQDRRSGVSLYTRESHRRRFVPNEARPSEAGNSVRNEVDLRPPPYHDPHQSGP
jgi:hypothetical protein